MGAPVEVGSVFAGKYRIERVLGAGGMGVVFAAVHIHLGERVAIKFLNPEAMTDSTTLARFFREGQAAAKIRSEHVARVYDVGTLETGAPYLVMEHLEGEDLAVILKQRGPLPISEAVVYLLQACEAIAEAHARGIVHRDIKPGNLFVTVRPDGSPVVKVIDFGISKVAEAYGPGLAVTKTTDVRGSPLFMSPEQLLATRNADPRSDIWSLGVSLFNLLTNTYPFPAPTLPALYARVLHGEPVPLRALRPDAPARLEAAILHCLRRDASERCASVAELARAIGVYAPGQAEISVRRIEAVLPARSAPRVERPEPAKAVDPAPRVSGGTAPLVARTPERVSQAPGGTEVLKAGGAGARPSRPSVPTTQPMASMALPAAPEPMEPASVREGDPADPPMLDTWATTRKRPPGRGRAVVIAAGLGSALVGLFVSLVVVLRPRLEATSAAPTSNAASLPAQSRGEITPEGQPSSAPRVMAEAEASGAPVVERHVEPSPAATSSASASAHAPAAVARPTASPKSPIPKSPLIPSSESSSTFSAPLPPPRSVPAPLQTEPDF